MLLKDLIYKNYFDKFNFYFAKPINEILANIATPHVILFKDYILYDDDSEYLRRYYTIPESTLRIKNVSVFFST